MPCLALWNAEIMNNKSLSIDCTRMYSEAAFTMGKDCSTGHFPKGKKGKFQNSKGARYSKRKTSKSTAANQDNQGQILAKEDRNRYDAGGHHSGEQLAGLAVLLSV